MIFFYLVICGMPLVSHPIWASFIGDLTVIKWVGTGALVYACVAIMGRRSPPGFLRTRQARWFLLLMAMALVSCVTLALPTRFEISPLFSFLSFLGLFLVTLIVVDTPQRLRTSLLVAVGAVGFASLHLLKEWFNEGFAAGYRPGWVTGDPNYFSLSALLCLPIAFYLLRTRQPRWERWFCLGALPIMLLALTAAASRGAFLGLMAGLTLVAWRSHARVKVAALTASVILPMMLLSPASPITRLLNPGYGDQESTDTRAQLWRAGLRMIAANPLTGVGVGNFKPFVGRYGGPDEELRRIAHNSYIELGGEMGLPGLLVFLAVLYYTLRSLNDVMRRTADRDSSLFHVGALAMQTGVVAYAVAILFVSGHYEKMFWLMVFLSMSMSMMSVTQETQLGSETSAPKPSRWQEGGRTPGYRLGAASAMTSRSRRAAGR